LAAPEAVVIAGQDRVAQVISPHEQAGGVPYLELVVLRPRWQRNSDIAPTLLAFTIAQETLPIRQEAPTIGQVGGANRHASMRAIHARLNLRDAT
jgi:hypothetical protein